MQWKPPAVAAGAHVHTVAGLLPAATSLGWPGWGLWDGDAFDVATAAYYPVARARFGFHDTLAGLPVQGKVSYVVVGWYASTEHDPLYNAKNRRELLDRWKLARTTHTHFFQELATAVQVGPAVIQAWKPAGITIATGAAPPAAQVRHTTRATSRGGSPAVRRQRLQKVGGSIPTSPAGGVIREDVAVIAQVTGPNEILCHGSVVDVPLAGAAAPAAIKNEQVKLYPPSTGRWPSSRPPIRPGKMSITLRCCSATWIQYKGTISGILDMPGQAHAKTFQGVPGKARRFARIEVYDRSRLVPAKQFNLALPKIEGRATSGHWPTMLQRSARVSDHSLEAAKVPPGLVKDLSTPAGPTGPPPPSEAQKEAWATELQIKFDAVVAAATAAGKPIDDRLIRVQDNRKNAQPLSMGHSADRTGSNQSGFWLDRNDREPSSSFSAPTGPAFGCPSADQSRAARFSAGIVRGRRNWSWWDRQVVPLRAGRPVPRRRSAPNLGNQRLVCWAPPTVSSREKPPTPPLGSKPGVPPKPAGWSRDGPPGVGLPPLPRPRAGGNPAQFQSAIHGLWVTRASGARTTS